jgi:CheY-like chemotaxis protein
MNTATDFQKKRILVVDDRASNTRLAKLYLEQTNEYIVMEQNDARAALSSAAEFRPHLILLDLMMPGMNGGELAATFRANPKFESVPIVFLTAAVTKREVKEGSVQIGEWPILAKPMIMSELLACLKQQLGGWRVAKQARPKLSATT